jgi:hypothetical protein
MSGFFWIYTNMKQPEYSGSYLVIYLNPYTELDMEVASYDADENEWSSFNPSVDNESIIAWSILPEIPAELKK